MSTKPIVRLFTAALLLIVPTIAWAQSAGAIAGVARDTTGAVLPGVTVEVASPALIEKVRVAVTDGEGNYKITGLRPGLYTVTFTLPGFSTFRREGIELTTDFTATANAEMKLGALEETVTVTGASPVVDIQNVRTRSVISRELLDTVPVAKTLAGYTALTLGATMATTANFDVGGNKGEQPGQIVIHGGTNNDFRATIDGMSIQTLAGAGSGGAYRVNSLAFQETTLEISGMSAESETGGVQVNHVPKDGGNGFSLYSVLNRSGGGLQSENLSDEHRARGAQTGSELRDLYDYGTALGGPIMNDKLWFYTAHRWWETTETIPGQFFNSTQTQFIGAPNSGVVRYTPDLSKPAFSEIYQRDHSGRLSWQASAKQKLSLYQSVQYRFGWYNNYSSGGATESRAPEAAWTTLYLPVSYTQGTWNYVSTNRLLFQAGYTVLLTPKTTPYAPGVTPEHINIVDTLTGQIYGSSSQSLSAISYTAKAHIANQANGRVAVSYVTGSHAFKGGLTLLHGWDKRNAFTNQSLSYTFRGGAPQSLTQWASPIIGQNNIRNIGLFVQDQWTVERLTLNLGVRFDTFKGKALAADLPASRFLPARHFDAVDNVPNWKDLSPRVGASYDLFGDGKTAIKGSIGRYVQAMGIGVTEPNNPQYRLSLSATRTWDDANADFVPNCDLTSPAVNGECGALTNANFGKVISTTRYADDVLRGFGRRPYTWGASVALQRELRAQTALNIGYFRTWYGNFTVTDNLAVTPADYKEYCVAAPADPRLPGGGSQQFCGLYDLNPNKFGQVDNLVSQASNFGDRSRVFNGVDVGLNARFGKGGMLTGGVSVGRTVIDECAVVDSPQAAREGFCKITPPWGAGTQFKVGGVYPLPWQDIQIGGTYQNIPGALQLASRTYRNAEVVPSLGRNLSAGVNGTVTIPLIASETVFEDRIKNLDLRFTKAFRLKAGRIQATFDIFNILNAGAILGSDQTYGPNWLRPRAIQGGRLLKFGTVVSF